MAIINIKFNTIDKTATFDMEGEAMSNVGSVSLYQSYEKDKYSLSLEMNEFDKENGVAYRECLYSSKNEKNFPSKTEGLFQEPRTIKVNQKIVDALRNRGK